MRRWDHWGGHRPSHDGGRSAVENFVARLRELERQAECVGPRGHARPFGPFDQQHGFAGGIQSELIQLRRVLDPEQVDMPNRRPQVLIGLNDRKAGAGRFTFMAKSRDKPAGQRSLADAERPGKRDDIARTSNSRQSLTKSRRFRLARQDHRDPRGIVRVTFVPSPFFD